MSVGDVRAYEVTMPHEWPEYVSVINARSAGAARNAARISLRSAGYEVSFKHLHVRSLGAPRTTDKLARVAEYRGRPELVAGARVRFGEFVGVVVDADDSCNFVVECDDGRRRAHVHPMNLHLVEPEAARG